MSTEIMVSAKSESNIEPVPEGLHQAVCITIYDVGTLHNEHWDNYQRKAVLTWELPDLPPMEFNRDGEDVMLPRCLSRRFTLSLGVKSHLRHVLESWRGKKFTDAELNGFNLASVLGAPCQVQVMHAAGKEGKVYANVANVLPAPKKAVIKPTSERHIFSVSQLTGCVLPDWLPEWVGKLVMESREWAALSRNGSAKKQPQPTSTSPAPVDDDDDDVMPF